MLEHLSLAFLTFTRQTAGILANFTNLKSLMYGYDCQLLDEDIITLSGVMPRLTSFGAVSEAGISDASIIAVAPYCRSLESLDISLHKNLTDMSLQALVPHCSSLRVLRMSDLVHVTDDGLHDGLHDGLGVLALIQSCPLLIELDLGVTDEEGTNISNECLNDVCWSCPLLQCITIPVYDYDVIAHLIEHGQNLRKITWGTIYTEPKEEAEEVEAPHDPRVTEWLEQHHWNPCLGNGYPSGAQYTKKLAYTVSPYTAVFRPRMAELSKLEVLRFLQRFKY